MSTATVVITTVKTPLVGTVPQADILVTLTDSAGVIQTATLTGAEVPLNTAVFNNVAAVAGATGTVTAQARDTAGAALGAVASQTFTEIGSPLQFNLPTSIGVTIA